MWEVCVELACDVALEASDCFGFGLAFGAAALEVAAGCGVVRETGDHDPPQCAVGLAVTGAAEAMSLLFAAGRVERCGAAKSREGSLVMDPVGVLAGGDEQCARGIGPDTETLDHRGGGLGDQWCQQVLKRADLFIEFPYALCERLECETVRVCDVGPAVRTEPCSRLEK